MPNWCENNLVVTGSVTSLDKWRITLANEKSLLPLLSFNKLLPLPKKEGDDWYNWRNNNWGTKWDIVSDEEVGLEPDDYSNVHYSYSFDTAWGPPIELLKNISDDFEGVEFKIVFAEPGCCFAGTFIIDSGKVIKEEHVDNPEEMHSYMLEHMGFSYWENEDMEDEEWD